MRLCVIAAALTIGACSTSAPPFTDTLPCQDKWVWETVRAQFGTSDTFGITQLTPNPSLDAEIANLAKGDPLSGLALTLRVAMYWGAVRPTYEAVVGPSETVGPVLDKVFLDLSGSQLPYLTFLLIGPAELRDDVAAAVGRLGGTFLFVPLELHQCSDTPKDRSASKHLTIGWSGRER